MLPEELQDSVDKYIKDQNILGQINSLDFTWLYKNLKIYFFENIVNTNIFKMGCLEVILFETILMKYKNQTRLNRDYSNPDDYLKNLQALGDKKKVICKYKERLMSLYWINQYMFDSSDNSNSEELKTLDELFEDNQLYGVDITEELLSPWNFLDEETDFCEKLYNIVVNNIEYFTTILQPSLGNSSFGELVKRHEQKLISFIQQKKSYFEGILNQIKRKDFKHFVPLILSQFEREREFYQICSVSDFKDKIGRLRLELRFKLE